MKLIIAILVIAAVPVCAQAQKRSAAKVTKADAVRVLEIISGDKAKTQTFCESVKLADQIEGADKNKALELNQKMDELVKKLGPEYNAMVAALQDTDLESEDGQEIGSTLEALDKLCAK
jgi:hypothetical protein